MTDSIEELAARLEYWAREDSKCSEPKLGLGEHATLRAAALKLRECAEREKALTRALKPFAAYAAEQFAKWIPPETLCLGSQERRND